VLGLPQRLVGPNSKILFQVYATPAVARWTDH
jgi:hypothetical protein